MKASTSTFKGSGVSGSKGGGVGGNVPLPEYTMLSLQHGKHTSRNASEEFCINESKGATQLILRGLY